MTSNYCFRVDREVRRKAEDVFGRFGMYLSDAINVFLRQAIMCNGFPFELRADAETPAIEQLPTRPAEPPALVRLPVAESTYTVQEIEAAVQLLKALKAS